VARSKMVALVTSGGESRPAPLPRKWIMFRCNFAALSGDICRFALSPKPVVTP
jgi:hypothetical protein